MPTTRPSRVTATGGAFMLAVVLALIATVAQPVDSAGAVSTDTATAASAISDPADASPTITGPGRIEPAMTDERAPAAVFESRCLVEGSFRTVPLHPAIGGTVGKLTKGTGSPVRLDEPLPPGTYQVSYLSYDGYPGRESIVQLTEVWEVLFLSELSAEGILGTVGPTMDLADYVGEAYEFSWPPEAVSRITTGVDTTYLAIRHAAAPSAISPNSVQPVCLNLFRIDDPSPTDGTCDAADLVYRNSNADFGSTVDKLWNRSTSSVLARPDPALPPGSYRLVGASYDGYDGRGKATWETEEIWVAEFWSSDDRLLAVSEPSADLPDGPGYEEARWEGSMGRVVLDQPAARIVVRHAASDVRPPNSVHVACLGLSWEEEPGLDEILALKGYAQRRPVNWRYFSAGGYELELLAEFTSGHATNAVGYHYRGSTACNVVFDGPAGGPGLTATGLATFTVDRDIGLCIQGPESTWYTDPDVNVDGLRAADISASTSMPSTFLIGFEDFIDGDFQDLVVRLTRTAAPGPVAGLPDARPFDEVPWPEVTPDWLLTVVHGEVSFGEQPQGLYLVNPDGDRWVLASSLRDPRVESLARILDWDMELHEALVLVSGPRDLQHVQLFELKEGLGRPVTSRVGSVIIPQASFLPSNAGVFLYLDDTGGGPRLVFLARSGVEGPVVGGATYPPGTRVDWIESFAVTDFVVGDALAVGSAPGRVTYYRGPLYEEEMIAFEDCVPVRWIRPGELAAVCDSVGNTTGLDLWVIPIDGSPMWPVVDPEVTATLGVEGFRDLYLSDGHLVLESAAGDAWLLEEGCGVPFRAPLPSGSEGLDVVGAVDRAVIASKEGRLLRLPIGGGSSETLLDGVVDTARYDAGDPIGTDTFPAPPSDPGTTQRDTCRKQGDGNPALLSDIRWGRHDTYTRVVFDFEADAPSTPGWSVQYVDGPVVADNPVGPTITGDGLLEVWLHPSSTVDHSDPAGSIRQTYTGPSRVEVGVGGVAAITIVEDFEGYLRWVIQVSGRKPFSAFTLANPPRLVIDIDR